MSRPLRLRFPGARYHVFARGNARELLFVDDRDRRDFLRLLGVVVDRYRLRCHAYCLMSNHYHCIIETPEANISAAMHRLNGVYAQRFNRRQARTGHVFEGRFGSSLIEDETYLLEASRYVVLNPVRAGLVARPEDWAWSSFGATAGLTRIPRFLAVEETLSAMSTDLEAAREVYRAFVNDPLQAAMQLTPIHGSASFIRGLEPRLRRYRSATELPKRERFAARPPLDEIFDAVGSRESQLRAVHAARHDHGYLLREIAAYLGVHYSTISRIAGGTFGVRS